MRPGTTTASPCCRCSWPVARRSAPRCWASALPRAADASAAEEVAAARDYLERALAYLDPPPARLVALGGVSGTGKSTLARQLAPELGPAPGAVVLRSDVVRKRLHGVAPGDRLPPVAYRKEASRAVYDALAAARRRAAPRRPCGDRGCGVSRSRRARADRTGRARGRRAVSGTLADRARGHPGASASRRAAATSRTPRPTCCASSWRPIQAR